MDRALDEIVAERHVSSPPTIPFSLAWKALLKDRFANTTRREVVDLADAVVVVVEMIVMISLVMA
jgi:hypothetical protein